MVPILKKWSTEICLRSKYALHLYLKLLKGAVSFFDLLPKVNRRDSNDSRL